MDVRAFIGKRQIHNDRNTLLFNVFSAYSVADHLVFKQIHDQAVAPERGLIPLSVHTAKHLCATTDRYHYR